MEMFALISDVRMAFVETEKKIRGKIFSTVCVFADEFIFNIYNN